MWRDIGVLVEDMRATGQRAHKIGRLLGLKPVEIHGILNRTSPQGAAIIKRQNSMVDPTDVEIAAIQAASPPAGEYLESLGKTDLAALEEAEWFTLLEIIVTAYTDKMAELAG